MQPNESCSDTSELPVAQELRSLAHQARKGDASALQRLRTLLDSHRAAWQHIGDLDRLVVRSWVDLLAGGDPLTSESIHRKAEDMRQQLEGEKPSPIERMVAAQVVTSWLELAHAQTQAARGTQLLRQTESAQKRFLAALKALATLRAGLASGLLPTQQPRVFDAGKVRA
jgi:hypothetical protein